MVKTYQLSNLMSSSGFFVLLSAFIRNACGYSESTCSNWFEVPSTKNVAVSIWCVFVLAVRIDWTHASREQGIFKYIPKRRRRVVLCCSVVAMLLCCRHTHQVHIIVVVTKTELEWRKSKRFSVPAPRRWTYVRELNETAGRVGK